MNLGNVVKLGVYATDVDEALKTYQEQRQPIARKIVAAANTSATWYESFGEKMGNRP